MRVLIDGEPFADAEAAVSIFDWGLVRGFGCFEVLRSYDGALFRRDDHLDRLQRSAAIMGLELPRRADLARWLDATAAEGADCLVRCMITAGSRDELFTTPGRSIITWEPLPHLPPMLRLGTRPAPWHGAGGRSELTGAKTLSYAPNMAATLAAQAEGFDEALLVGGDGVVLEGPTFAIAWFRDGVLETPSLDLNILASITRAVVLDLVEQLGVPIAEGRFGLDRLRDADEVVAMSTVKEVHPVSEVSGTPYGPGAMTDKLRSAFRQLVQDELGGR